MYQPKIREDLIPRLYRLAHARRIPMTTLVSDLLEGALERLEKSEADGYQTAARPQAEGEN